jgi:hypothetical protein
MKFLLNDNVGVWCVVNARKIKRPALLKKNKKLVTPHSVNSDVILQITKRRRKMYGNVTYDNVMVHIANFSIIVLKKKYSATLR